MVTQHIPTDDCHTNTPNPPSLSFEELETEIATLSATLQAATFRLITLVGELDACDAWADPLSPNGFKSCAHFLSWRVSLDLGTARQYVRVARALKSLPRISQAFSKGELSYSKVRALTRIATPQTEESLLEMALIATASQIETLVRRHRRADQLKENERAVMQQASRSLVAFFDDDGMLVLKGRLPAEQGAIVMKAFELSSQELLKEKDGSEESPQSPSDEKEVFGNKEQEKKEQDKQADAPKEGEHGSEESQTASSEATKPRARGLASDAIMADALVRVAKRALSAQALSGSGGDRFLVMVHVDKEVLENPDEDGRSEIQDGPNIAPETVRRLACDCSVCTVEHGPDGEIAAGRRTRVISPQLRRALVARDGTHCGFPGCRSLARDVHHAESWINGGLTVPDNLRATCLAHHHLLHEGGYRVEALGKGKFRFLDPKGREIPQSPSLPVVAGDAQTTLLERWVEKEACIAETTGMPTWQGEPFDYDWTVEALLFQRDHGACSPDLLLKDALHSGAQEPARGSWTSPG